MTTPLCMWRDVETGARVCLMGHDHRPRLARPMVRRRPRRDLRPLIRAGRQLVGAGLLAAIAYIVAVVTDLAGGAA